MNKIFALCFLTVCLSACFSVKAQNISIGVKGGISVPNLSAGSDHDNPLSTGYKSRLGPDAAIFAEFKLSDVVSIQPMVEYSSQGGKKTGLQAFPTPAEAAAYFAQLGQPTPPYLYGNFKNEAKLSYLMVPILAKFGFNLGESPFRIYASVGPFASLLLSAKNLTSGSSQVYVDAAGREPILLAGTQSFASDMDIKSELKKYNAGVEGNLGVSYAIGNSRIFIEGGGNYGFVSIQKDAANGKNYTGAVVALLGYSFSF